MEKIPTKFGCTENGRLKSIILNKDRRRLSHDDELTYMVIERINFLLEKVERLEQELQDNVKALPKLGIRKYKSSN